MKTAEKIIKKADTLKTCGNIMGKAGYGMRLAAIFGYKVGYNMAKHPNLDKVKKQIEKHPQQTGLLVLAGLGLSALATAGILLRGRQGTI